MSDFNETGIFFNGFSKNTEISNFMKIRPVGAELSQAEGQVGMTNLTVVFRSFAKAPKNLPVRNTSIRVSVLKLYLEHNQEDLTVHKQVKV